MSNKNSEPQSVRLSQPKSNQERGTGDGVRRPTIPTDASKQLRVHQTATGTIHDPLNAYSSVLLDPVVDPSRGQKPYSQKSPSKRPIGKGTK